MTLAVVLLLLWLVVLVTVWKAGVRDPINRLKNHPKGKTFHDTLDDFFTILQFIGGLVILGLVTINEFAKYF